MPERLDDASLELAAGRGPLLAAEELLHGGSQAMEVEGAGALGHALLHEGLEACLAWNQR